VRSLNVLQGWAYEVVERVVRKQVAEDDLVEFKSAWIDPDKAARRIAAQANAARGEDFLWLIGIDPRQNDPFVQIDPVEPDAWLREVESYFVDRRRPEWRCFQLTYNDKSIYVIAFGTAEFPFLISLKKINQKSGCPEGIADAELPWRSGTGTRSATRQQILSLLYDIPPLPDIEVMGSEFVPFESETGTVDFDLGFYAKLYIIPRSPGALVIPFHRVGWSVWLPDGSGRQFMASCRFYPQNKPLVEESPVMLGRLFVPFRLKKGFAAKTEPSDSIELRASELVIKGSGIVWFIGLLRDNWDELSAVEVVHGKILLSVGPERTLLPVNFESHNIFPAIPNAERMSS